MKLRNVYRRSKSRNDVSIEVSIRIILPRIVKDIVKMVEEIFHEDSKLIKSSHTGS